MYAYFWFPIFEMKSNRLFSLYRKLEYWRNNLAHFVNSYDNKWTLAGRLIIYSQPLNFVFNS